MLTLADWKEEATIAGTVLKKMRTGDHITDAELNRSIPYIKSVIRMFGKGGPVWYMALMALNMNLNALEGYQLSREGDKEDAKRSKKV